MIIYIDELFEALIKYFKDPKGGIFFTLSAILLFIFVIFRKRHAKQKLVAHENNLKHNIINAIRDSDIKTALEIIEQSSLFQKDREFAKTVVMIASQYNQLEKDNFHGLETQKEIEKRRNEIKSKILNLVNDLDL